MFKIPRWKGNDDDTTLFHLTAFLKGSTYLIECLKIKIIIYKLLIILNIFSALAALEIDDMRDALLYYQQFDDPIEAFKANRERVIVSIFFNF